MLGNGTARATWRGAWWLCSGLSLRAVTFLRAVTLLGAVTFLVVTLGSGPAQADDTTPPNGGSSGSESGWLLSSGALRPEMAAASVVPALANRLGLATLGTTFNRSADFGPGSFCVDDNNNMPRKAAAAPRAQASSEACNSFVWGRLFGETGSLGGGPANGAFGRYGPASYFSQAGVVTGGDLYRTSRDKIGLFGSAATATATVNGAAGGTLGMNQYGVGGYWSHRDPGGWYSDLALQGSRYENLRSSANAGPLQNSSGWGVAASAETGYVALLGQGYSVIPQAQLIYQRIDLGGILTPLGGVLFAPTDDYYGRVGARFNRVWQTTGGCAVSTWAETNIWHQFGDTRTSFVNQDGSNPINLGASLGGTWAQIGLGISGQLSRNWSMFGSADYNIAFSQPGHSLGGRAGIRLAW